MRVYRPVIPECGASISPARVAAAERKFAVSVRREAGQRPASGQERKIEAHAARRPGQRLGGGFARLNTEAIDRMQSHVDAIVAGIRQANHEREAERELSSDPDFLRSMGFHGRSDDDF
jgi:hypothetical protein